MAKKKLTTEEILARARAKDSGDEGDSANEKPAESKESKPVAQKQSTEKKASPSSTSDILAKARAQAAGKPEAAKPASSPGSTKDILAAARAQASTGKGTSEKQDLAAGGESVEKSPAGDRPSVQEMLETVRGKKLESGEQAPVTPSIPKKPIPRSQIPEVKKLSRRNALVSFFTVPLNLAWTSFIAANALFTLACARFMMPNILPEPPSKFKVGPPSDFPSGTVSTKFKAEHAIWMTHTSYKGQNMIYALSTVCTHLGCTPNWLEGEQKFKCPCHGSGFYPDGINFEGPAPRPLERMGIRLAPDGKLEVDKSVKFQEELGQWSDPNSFFPTS